VGWLHRHASFSGRKVPQVQIDPAALTASIGKLYGLKLERGLAPTLQQVVL
jgi:hypothetical protein